MHTLINLIKKYTDIDNSTEITIFENLEFASFKKNEYILQQGLQCNKMYFIKSGLVRNFYLHDGKEITSWIYSENEIFTSWPSFYRRKPSIEYLEACEDTKVITIDYHTRLELISKFPQFEKFGRLYNEELLANIDELSKRFRLMSAKEKYYRLIELSPNIIQRAKLGHIASLLGISQETLSRIRSKK